MSKYLFSVLVRGCHWNCRTSWCWSMLVFHCIIFGIYQVLQVNYEQFSVQEGSYSMAVVDILSSAVYSKHVKQGTRHHCVRSLCCVWGYGAVKLCQESDYFCNHINGMYSVVKILLYKPAWFPAARYLQGFICTMHFEEMLHHLSRMLHKFIFLVTRPPLQIWEEETLFLVQSFFFLNTTQWCHQDSTTCDWDSL